MSQLAISQDIEVGATLAFDAIAAAGAYICDWSGHLLRVPATALDQMGTPKMNVVGQSPLTVTKISDDPFIPLADAKREAAARGLVVKF